MPVSNLGSHKSVQIDQCTNAAQTAASKIRRRGQEFTLLAEIKATIALKHDKYDSATLALNCDKSSLGKCTLLIYGK